MKYIFFYFLFFISGCSPKNSHIIVPQIDVPNGLFASSKKLLIKANFDGDRHIKQFKKCMDQNYAGEYELLGQGKLIDQDYPDTSIYKFVMVLFGSLSESDFNGISNKEQFFDSTGSFVRKGSSFYIFDRTSSHRLYQSNIEAMIKITNYRYYSTIGELRSYSDIYFDCNYFSKYLALLCGKK